jgi:uncharacterized protein (TIGR00251 family)
MEDPLPYTILPDGLRLAVRLVPKARQDALEGLVIEPDGRAAVKLRLRAPPVEGAANAALLEWLAAALGERRSAVTLQSGKTSRLKILHLAGDGPRLAAKVQDWLARSQPGA